MTHRQVRGRHQKRDLLIWLYDGCCFWCGEPMMVEAHSSRRDYPLSMSFDELKPLARGGWRVLANQVPAHKCCNMRRGNVVAPQAAFDRHHAVLKAAGISIEER